MRVTPNFKTPYTFTITTQQEAARVLVEDPAADAAGFYYVLCDGEGLVCIDEVCSAAQRLHDARGSLIQRVRGWILSTFFPEIVAELLFRQEEVYDLVVSLEVEQARTTEVLGDLNHYIRFGKLPE